MDATGSRCTTRRTASYGGPTTGSASPSHPSAPPSTGVACTARPNTTRSASSSSPITTGDNWIERRLPPCGRRSQPGAPSSTRAAQLRERRRTTRRGSNGRCQASLPAASQPSPWNTVIVDTVPTGGFSFAGPAGSTVGGNVATITDPNTSATPSAYSATINWGDGSTSPGTITGGNGSFNVAGTHAYSAGGSYPVAVTITSRRHQPGQLDGQRLGRDHLPAVAGVDRSPPSIGRHHGRVHRLGRTRAGWRPRRSSSTGWTRNTRAAARSPTRTRRRRRRWAPTSPSHTVSASVTGLVPNAIYHVRLVATNSAGTTFGPDVTFTTLKTAPPGPPDARQDVQHLAGQRGRADQAPRHVRAAHRATADPQEHA